MSGPALFDFKRISCVVHLWLGLTAAVTMIRLAADLTDCNVGWTIGSYITQNSFLDACFRLDIFGHRARFVMKKDVWWCCQHIAQCAKFLKKVQNYNVGIFEPFCYFSKLLAPKILDLKKWVFYAQLSAHFPHCAHPTTVMHGRHAARYSWLEHRPAARTSQGLFRCHSCWRWVIHVVMMM